MKDFYQNNMPIDSLTSVLQLYDKAPGYKAWFTTNHDENSWNGTEYEKYGDAAKAFAVFSCTWPGLPLIYSGQELPNKKRLEFFKRDTIAWTGKNELHDFYKTLFNARFSNPALVADAASAPALKLRTSDDASIFAFLRGKGEREVLVILNLTNKKNLRFDLVDDRIKGTYTNIFSGAENDFTIEKSFEMQPWEFLVYEK
jgi:glycosidase